LIANKREAMVGPGYLRVTFSAFDSYRLKRKSCPLKSDADQGRCMVGNAIDETLCLPPPGPTARAMAAMSEAKQVAFKRLPSRTVRLVKATSIRFAAQHGWQTC